VGTIQTKVTTGFIFGWRKTVNPVSKPNGLCNPILVVTLHHIMHAMLKSILP